MSLKYKIVIAALSGLVCFAIYDIPSGKLPGGDSPFGFLFYCALMGLPFSAGVLFPYLHRKTWIVLKGITLVFVSGLSFVFALLVVFAAHGATWTWGSPGKLILVAASLVGTSVVLTGARYVIPLSYLPGLLTAGVFAAIPGGLIFGVLDDAQWYLAFMTWNGLIATSIHIAETNYWRVLWLLKSKSET